MDETSSAVDKIWCPPLIPEVFLLSPKNQEKRMISSWHRQSLEQDLSRTTCSSLRENKHRQSVIATF